MASLVWTPRRLVVALAVTGTVAASLGVLVGSFLLPASDGGSRTDGNASAEPTANITVPVAAAPSATARPSETAHPPGTGEPGTTGGAFPGAPTRINEFGVPVGYPHTEAGAISACGNYVSAYSDVRNREPTRIRQLFQSISLPSATDSLADEITQIDRKNAQDYGVSSILAPNVNFNVRVAGFMVRSYAGDKASISVWGVSSFGIYGNGNVVTAPRQGWGTDHCELQWSSGDWKISSAGDGPAGPDIVERSSEGYGRFLLLGAAG